MKVNVRRAEGPGSNPGPGENFFNLKLVTMTTDDQSENHILSTLFV